MIKNIYEKDAGETFMTEERRPSTVDGLRAIELQYRIEDPMIPAIKIGQPCRIIKNGTVYRSVLTG